MKKRAVVVGVVLLSACTQSAKEEFNNAFDESFRTSYKASFVKSCVKSAGSEAFESVCRCVASELLEKFSVDELRDQDKVTAYVQNEALAKCSPEPSSEAVTE